MIHGQKLFILIIVAFTNLASAQVSNEKSAVLSVKKGLLPVTLDYTTVKCSSSGYKSPELKVLIPSLAPVTALNHRKPGESAPCVSAGVCSDQLDPQNIFKNGRIETKVPVSVKLIRIDKYDVENKTCNTILKEEVSALIANIPFKAINYQNTGNRVLDDCLK